MLRELFYEVFKFIGDLNYWHVALLSALESTAFPVVIPVETVIIPMGYYAYLGTKSLALLVFSCTTGIVIGCLINYAFARFLGRTFIYKHAKLLHINIEKLQKLEAKFLTHGRLLMFVGRFVPIPAFKHIITIPAGMAKMPVGQFVFYNALGGLIFSTSMLLIGYFFGSSEELWRKALGKFIVICFVLLVVYIAIRIIIKMIIKKSNADEDTLSLNEEENQNNEHETTGEYQDDDVIFGKRTLLEYKERQNKRNIANKNGFNKERRVVNRQNKVATRNHANISKRKLRTRFGNFKKKK